MKKALLLVTLILLISGSLGYMILFEGKFENFESWWDHKTRANSSIPFSPYKKYRKDSSLLYFEDANEIEIYDQHLFWKGSGAIAKPELSQKHELLSVVVTSGGFGYSNKVEARVTGSSGQKFKLGPVVVKNGKVTSIGIKESDIWTLTPRAYHGDDVNPYSGVIETKFQSGQVIEEVQYLDGQKHGLHTRYNERGIPVFSKEYSRGLKHGTHIFWFSTPLDPDNYKSQGEESYPSLWVEINEQAKNKYLQDYGTMKSNEWVVSKYKMAGGSFGVRLLEHWFENKKHGLFEGFDKFGNKTFKDEYKYGLRTKHRTFDKTK